MYRNFIFDLYGTLVDIHTNERKASFWKKCAALLTEFGCPYEPAELRKAYFHYIKLQKVDLSRKFTYPEVDLSKVFLSLFADKGFYPDKSFLSYYASTFRVLSRDFLSLYPDTIAILETLKQAGRNVYLLSNAQTLFTVPEMKELGIYDYFDDVLISSELSCKKPDTAFMQKLLDKHNLVVEESIMIGNEFESDIAVANAVGMDSFYIHTDISPELTGEETATYIDTKTGYLPLKKIQSLLK